MDKAGTHSRLLYLRQYTREGKRQRPTHRQRKHHPAKGCQPHKAFLQRHLLARLGKQRQQSQVLSLSAA